MKIVKVLGGTRAKGWLVGLLLRDWVPDKKVGRNRITVGVIRGVLSLSLSVVQSSV